jgi:predicted transcriptional regulator of viral defense system
LGEWKSHGCLHPAPRGHDDAYSRETCIVIIMTSVIGMRLVDGLAAEGRTDVSSDEVRIRLGLSPQAVSNLLTRLERDGLVERVRRGFYLLRPLGELGVAAVSSDRLAEAVVLAVGDRDHRICFRTALHEHGLLTRGSQRVQVAVTRRLFVKAVGGRFLESIIEHEATIHVGAQSYGTGMISTVERALLESARTPRRVGGISVVAEGLAAALPNPRTVQDLSNTLGLDVALRRLVSLDRQLGLGKLNGIDFPKRASHPLRLDPTDERSEGTVDTHTGVRWPGPIEELQEVVRR